jgi:hypothetical protein
MFGKKNGSYKSILKLSLVRISANAGPWPHPKSNPVEFEDNFSFNGLMSLDKKFL